jgi:aspartokinase-like uncharacterized kinase
MWIVKLGGSLAFSPALPRWLEVLASPGRRKIVVVPGGGPFADQVRRAQTALSFPDGAAHRMAVLATEQYGLMLCALAPGLRPAATLDEIRTTQDEGRVPVWMAARMTAERDDIPACWEVTSDSLAAWLAGVAGADLLVLVKAAPPPREAPAGGVPVAELGRAGLVDGAFASFIRGRAFAVRCVGAAGHGDMARAFEGGAPPGVRVSTDQ